MLYNYLLSGLEELHLGQPQKLSIDDLLTEIRGQLTPKDERLLSLLLLSKDSPEVAALVEQHAEEREQTTLSDDDFKTQMLYQYGMQSKNKFVRAWFAYNLDLNNVLAATICRAHHFDVLKAIIGDNETAQQLRKNSSAKDFGLAGILPDYAEMMQLADLSNPLERERQMDALRWNWIEEHTLFHNFEIENVLAYYLQSVILHRWDGLTVEKGEKVFRDLLADLKKGVHIADVGK